MSEFPYSRLRRLPDVEAKDLQAHDATDVLLVERAIGLGIDGAQTVVIGDEYGAITLALTHAGLHGLRVHQDLATGRRALLRNAEELMGLATPMPFTSHELDAELLAGAKLVLLQLPKSLAELDEISDAVARWAASDVVLIAGGRVKHMTLSQNEVLGRRFAHVQPQRAERKSRLIVASEPLPVSDESDYPVTAQHDGLVLMAHGGAFAGARLDIGTRVLRDALGLDGALRQAQGPTPSVADPSDPVADPPAPVAEPVEASPSAPVADPSPSVADPSPPVADPSDPVADPSAPVAELVEASHDVLDLGCGTGALAVAYALTHPTARVVATDRSAAAVASARATVVANAVTERVTVTHDDAASDLPDASFDVVLLNPPFHLGSSIHTGAATRLFEAAARVLRPGGELFTVFNSSLGYRPELTRLIGVTEQLQRTSKFTVTRSVRRASDLPA
ncbi:methyltransferase [Microbacterium sp. NPDC076768]|uniref:class I SAM-dependent methyltransferase n=1 Tax=Microbacterium sp. NPDC076768 TaxID=3154858 RepID=UPI003418103D